MSLAVRIRSLLRSTPWVDKSVAARHSELVSEAAGRMLIRGHAEELLDVSRQRPFFGESVGVVRGDWQNEQF